MHFPRWGKKQTPQLSNFISLSFSISLGSVLYFAPRLLDALLAILRNPKRCFGGLLCIFFILMLFLLITLLEAHRLIMLEHDICRELRK